MDHLFRRRPHVSSGGRSDDGVGFDRCRGVLDPGGVRGRYGWGWGEGGVAQGAMHLDPQTDRIRAVFRERRDSCTLPYIPLIEEIT